jgi:single-stranded-DNA-specific exonuclease
MAAGFSLEEDKIGEFRARLNELCCLTEEDMILKIGVDDKLGLIDVTLDLVEDIEKLEPFGKGNKEPVFMAEKLYIDRIFLMGQKKDSFKLMCRDSKSGVTLQAVKFFEVDLLRNLIGEAFGEDRVDDIIENPKSVSLRMDLLFKPSINEWNNVKNLQLGIVDYRISEE